MDQDTYQCFLKVKANMYKLPRVYELYEEACRKKGKHMVGPEGKIYDKELNYALTVYIGEVLKNPQGIQLWSVSGNTYSIAIGETIYSFIIEKTTGAKILINYIETQNTSDDAIIWRNKMKCEAYLMNTHTAYINFNGVRENKNRNFYQVVEERFEQLRAHLVQNKKVEFPEFNAKVSFQRGNDYFTIMIANTNGVPRDIVRTGNQITGFSAEENIPIFLVLDYEYKVEIDINCINAYIGEDMVNK